MYRSWYNAINWKILIDKKLGQGKPLLTPRTISVVGAIVFVFILA